MALLTTIIIALCVITGCPTGNDSTGAVKAVVTGITVLPETANVNQGGNQTFSATVTGTGAYPTAVTWSIVETEKQAGTSINASGRLTVAADEVIGSTLTIKASSKLKGYTNVFGTATVTVTDPSIPVTVTGITVLPETANVNQGGNQTFSAQVTGTGGFPTTVTWSIVENDIEAGTAIDASGRLTVAADEPVDRTLTVKATTTLENSDVYGTATVTVKAAFSLPDNIWLVGNLTDWLTGPKTPIALNDEGDGTWTWSGSLTEGYLKFSADSTSPVNYNGVWLTPTSNSAVAIGCAALDTPDSKPFDKGANKLSGSWQIVNPGVYTITVDFSASTVEFVRTANLAVIVSDIWLASTLTGVWAPPFAEQYKFTQKPDGTFIWTGDSFSTSTYFRFYTMSDAGGNYFAPLENNIGIDKDIVTQIPAFLSTTNFSWKSNVAGSVSIIIDAEARTFTIIDPAPVVTEITVFPETANVEQGKTKEFSATVIGKYGNPDTVIWSIDESDIEAGTGIDADGELTVAVDEPVGKILTIRASSTLTGYTDVSGTAVVTVITPSLVPVIESVTISPSGSVEVRKGRTQQFTVDVEAHGGASEDVTWSIVEAVDAGTTITQDGLLTVSPTETLTTITVVATPQESGFEDLADSVTVTIPAGIDTSNPSATHLIFGDAANGNWTGSKQMYDQGGNVYAWTGPLVGSNAQVQIRVSGSNHGPASSTTVSTEGGTWTVTAGQGNTFKITTAGTYTIKFDLNAPFSVTFIWETVPTVNNVTISADDLPVLGSVYIAPGGSKQFTADVSVSYGAATTVTWSIVENTVDAGTTISSTGLLTVSLDETLPEFTIRATPTEPGFASKAKDVTITTIVTSGFKVFMVGSAPPTTWSLSAVEMTDQGGGVFTWTGNLNVGTDEGLSFVSNIGQAPGWGSGVWFVSTEGTLANRTVQNTTGVDQPFNVTKNAGQAPMWKFAAAGNYTITLDTNILDTGNIPNPLNGTVTFRKN